MALLTGPAGHAPGAVWMRIGGKGGLLYSGDACAESLIFCAAPYPPAAAMVIDASYGVADQPLSAQIEQIMSQIDGPVLLPCPAGGRGLEIAATLLQRGLTGQHLRRASSCRTGPARSRGLDDATRS